MTNRITEPGRYVCRGSDRLAMVLIEVFRVDGDERLFWRKTGESDVHVLLQCGKPWTIPGDDCEPRRVLDRPESRDIQHMSRAETEDVFDLYGFKDAMGHDLLLCEDFQHLLDRAFRETDR